MDDVLARLRAAAPEIFTDLPVAAAYLFGSHARGEARPDSDVDIAVLAPDAPAHDRLDLRLQLMGRLSPVVDSETDVIVLDEAPLRLAGEVVREGIVIYSEDVDLRSQYESRTFRESVDFSVLADELDREMLRLTVRGQALMPVPVQIARAVTD